MAEFSRHTIGGAEGCTRWLNLVGTQWGGGGGGGGLHKVAEFSRHTMGGGGGGLHKVAEFSRHTMGGGGGCTRWLNLVGTQWGVGVAAQGG